MGAIDWHGVFFPVMPLAEMAVRGTLVYFALFLMLRILPRRELGSMGPADLLMIVLIADAAQNAMGAEYRSVTEGVVLVATILFWSWALDWLDYRFPELQLIGATPIALIRNGRLVRRNLRKQRITEEELMGQLRQHGVSTIAEVNQAQVEGDGRLSVVRRRQR